MLAVTISLFLLLSLPFILLSINKVQNVVVEKLSDFVEQKTGAILNIKHVSLSFFNTINIDSGNTVSNDVSEDNVSPADCQTETSPKETNVSDDVFADFGSSIEISDDDIAF